MSNCIENIEDMAAILLLGKWGKSVPLGAEDIVVLGNIVILDGLGVH